MADALILEVRRRLGPARLFLLWGAASRPTRPELLASRVATRWEKAADELLAHLATLTPEAPDREPSDLPSLASPSPRLRPVASSAGTGLQDGSREEGVVAASPPIEAVPVPPAERSEPRRRRRRGAHGGGDTGASRISPGRHAGGVAPTQRARGEGAASAPAGGNPGDSPPHEFPSGRRRRRADASRPDIAALAGSMFRRASGLDEPRHGPGPEGTGGIRSVREPFGIDSLIDPLEPEGSLPRSLPPTPAILPGGISRGATPEVSGTGEPDRALEPIRWGIEVPGALASGPPDPAQETLVQRLLEEAASHLGALREWRLREF